jgi:molecular chaperone HtpG
LTTAEVKTQPEKYEYNAEVKQLLHILVYSLYTNREIFLRELVSNASDALDKARHEELVNENVLERGKPLEIHIDFNEGDKILTISDNGIGLTHQEAIANLGTLGKSGSLEFIKKLTEEAQKNINIIGQFGVGFYSAFMAGKELRVISKSYIAEEPAVEWRSDGSGTFEILPSDRTNRGTTVEIHLKDDAVEFARKERITEIINKYSSFVAFPIFLGGKRLNEVSALWARPKNELKEEDYVGFYKFLTKAGDDPMIHIHYSADAPIQIHALLYVPKKNMELAGFGKIEHGLGLFSKKISIQTECKDLLPDYLRFVRGVVDSEDLPLNVSRETIQENALFNKIKSNVVGKFLGYLKKIADTDKENYEKFWREYGRILKEGIHTDFGNQDKLALLLRYNSSTCKEAEELVSFKEYVDRMPEGQKEIYYLCGTNRKALEMSPHIEIFKKKNIEVLYLLEPMDEYLLSGLREFEGKPIKSIDQVELDLLKDLKEEEGAAKETIADEAKLNKLLKHFKKVLGAKVSDVKESKRLSDSPCCVLSSDGASASIQKLMKMVNQDFESSPKVFELNPKHHLIKNLTEILETNKNTDVVDACCLQLFDNALMMDDLISNPREMVPRLNEMMEKSTDLILDKFGRSSIIIAP